jgi:hypothetical protein
MTDLISDLYKDATGSRPSRAYLESYKAMTPAQQDEEDDYLIKLLSESNIAEEAAYDRNYTIWFNSVTQIANTNGVTLGTAIRWDMDAHDVYSGYTESYDIGYYCFQTGIKYTNEAFIKNELKNGERA